MRLKPLGEIIQYTLILRNIVESLQFLVRPVFIGLVVDGVTRFKYEWLDVFDLYLC